MKMRDIARSAEAELDDQKKEIATGIIKSKLTEIQGAKLILAKLEKQYSDLLDRDLDEVLLDQKGFRMIGWDICQD